MKRFTILATVVALASGPAVAQTAQSGSESNSSSASNVQTQTQAASNVHIDQRAPGHQTQTLKNVPGVVAPSMSSGHPCAFSPVSGGIGIIGAGVSLGGMQIDDACLLAQMGHTDAATYMIAARNADACAALQAHGKVICGAAAPQAAAAPPAASPRPVAAAVQYLTCRKRDDGKIGMTYARGADKAVANAQCLRALGY